MKIRMTLQNGILPEGNPFFVPEQGVGQFSSLVLPLMDWDRIGRPESIVVSITNADVDLASTGEIPAVAGDYEAVVEILDEPPAPVASARRRYSHGGRVALPPAG